MSEEMTREQAIEELSILLNKWQDSITGDALDMAITALENELKVDNFIKTIPDINIGSNIQGIPCEFVLKMLGNISGWISVTDKLPSDCDEDWVLVQIQEDNGYLWIPRVMEYRKSKDDWWGEDIGWLKNSNGVFKVIAWMPLPEPYEPQESEDKE